MFWQTNNNDSDTYDIYRLYHLGIASQLNGSGWYNLLNGNIMSSHRGGYN